MKQTNRLLGGTLDDWLEEEGLLEEVKEASAKRIIAVELDRFMKANAISATEMAVRLHTSRSALRRILNSDLPSITLSTIERVAETIGMRARIVFEPLDPSQTCPR